MDPVTILAIISAALQLAKVGSDTLTAMQQSGATQSTADQAAALLNAQANLATAQAAVKAEFADVTP